MSKKEEHLKWHRLGGMVLTPLFNLLGYTTYLEVDLSLKQQLLDVLVVRRENISPKDSGLPKVYWEAFEDFNEHNLISFKSFHESFNGYALMEFHGHAINYQKAKEVDFNKINLYAITNHYPRKLLKPFEGTEFLTTIKKDEIFDLTLSTVTRVRFVILRTTDNPLLALFSNDPPKVDAGYQKLSQETDLLKEISIYFSKLSEYYGTEVNNMYTKEDFWRDYPPNENPFVFPWLKEYHEQEVQKIQKTAREAMRKAAQKAAKAEAEAAQKAAQAEAKAAQKVAEVTQEAARAKAEAAQEAKMESRIKTARTLLSMGMDLAIISKATELSEAQILSLKEEEVV